MELWNKYDMLPNIREHSTMVANIAVSLAKKAQDMGYCDIDVPTVMAAGLLHDIAKTYCLHYGGSHAQLGAAWSIAETKNYALAQGVMLHVYWPWEIPSDSKICSLPFFVIYADKRVRHDKCVSLDERFEDLIERYGKTEKAKNSIRLAYEQGKKIEYALSKQLEWNLHEDSFDLRRVVP